MKKIILYAVVFLMSMPLVLMAQSRSEFTVELSANEIEIKPGETKSIEVKVVRSKGFEKYKTKFGFSSATPEGISLKFETPGGVVSSSTLTISANANAKETSYMLLPNCVLNNKTKSAVLKLTVKGDSSVTRGE
jgi:hypothetical protein